MNHLRGEMDVEEPRVDLMWGRIESKIEQPAKLRSMWKYWAAAAGVAAIFALGYWSAGSPDPIAQPQLSIADLDPQMGQEEQRLQNEFMSRQAVLKEYEFNPEEVLIFESELAQIDSIDAEMRQMLGKVQNQERLLRTLLNHYQKKIQVIDRMIKKLEKQRRNENRNRDKMA